MDAQRTYLERTEPASKRAYELDTAEYVEYGEMYLKFKEDTPFDVWRVVTENLLTMEKSIRWWIGDAIRFGEGKYGEKYAQAIQATGYTYGTLRNSVYVANAYDELSLRNDNCSFRQHEIAASLEPEEREEVLDLAASNGWAERQLREEVKERRALPAAPLRGEPEVAKTHTCPHCGGTGEIVVIDE